MNPQVQQKFDSYPDDVRASLMKIRTLIFDVAKEDDLGEVEETLKWGEPSYVTKNGSALRMDWKPKFPDQYAVYFNCKTTLVETFKEVFGDRFNYEGNRAITFKRKEKIPTKELSLCLSASLRYHQIKKLPLLGF